MSDPRIERLSRVLVDYSTQIGHGDRVLIESEPTAEPLVRALFEHILKNGGHPHLLVSLSGMVTMTGMDDVFLSFADEEQISFTPTFYKYAYENFESRLRIHSTCNTKSLTNLDQIKKSWRKKATEPVLEAQFERGGTKEFRWVTTLFPTSAYAQDAEMSLAEFEDYVYQACHVADLDEDPIAIWKRVEVEQGGVIEALKDHDRIEIKGPNCDLTLSIKGRTFVNACGKHNMPDGEVYTGPVEESVDGWVRATYPVVSGGNEIEDIELKFKEGRVVEASASKNQAFLEQMLETDPGARYLGEFAIGTNYDIQRHTRNILFDEKIGGTFHIALGAGYPETGSKNKSAIHMDLLCGMRDGGEIAVDGDVIYRDGTFLL
jgi:aminopeptidase